MPLLVDRYHRAGFTPLDAVLPKETCQLLNHELTHRRNTSFFDRTGFGLLGQNAWNNIPLFADVLTEFRIPQYAGELLQLTEVLLFQDLIIWKPPHSERQVEWHQDYSYWPLNAPKGVTLWIALDDSSEDNGAMRYIPESHKWGECQPTVYTLSDSFQQESELPSLPLQGHEMDGVFVNSVQGSAIAHHPLCCHMSPINNSSTNRRAWSLTFLDPSVGWDPEHAPHPLNHQLQLHRHTPLKNGHFPLFSID